MHLDLTEEQALLQSSVRQFAEERVRPQAAAIDQSGRFPRELFAEAGELGLAGVCVPAAWGGARWTRCRMPSSSRRSPASVPTSE
jgi:alkylation response protein AidB-like acyl-CoA dehydrogenase